MAAAHGQLEPSKHPPNYDTDNSTRDGVGCWFWQQRMGSKRRHNTPELQSHTDHTRNPPRKRIPTDYNTDRTASHLTHCRRNMPLQTNILPKHSINLIARQKSHTDPMSEKKRDVTLPGYTKTICCCCFCHNKTAISTQRYIFIMIKYFCGWHTPAL